MKAQNKTVPNQFSKYGDIAQIDNDTFVDCNRNLIAMQQFHASRPRERLRRLRELREKQRHEHDLSHNETHSK